MPPYVTTYDIGKMSEHA